MRRGEAVVVGVGRTWGIEMLGSKQQGFSLTELMLAIFVLAIIMVAASSGIFQMSQGLVAADRSQRNFSAQESGSFMRDVFSKASPTFFFAHVPISLRSCAPKMPCVRRLDNLSRRFVPNETVTSDSLLSQTLDLLPSSDVAIEMYRDYNGELDDEELESIKSTSGKVFYNIRRASPLRSLPAVVSRAGAPALYATWPLRDTTSPGVPMLVQRDSDAYFSQIPGAASSASLSTKYGLFTSGTNNFNVEVLRKSLAVFFNTLEPTQFSIVYVGDVQPCFANGSSSPSSICQSVQNAINPTLNLSDPSLVGVVAAEIMPVDESPLASALASILPSIGAYYRNSVTKNWVNQSVNFTLFPKANYSVFESGPGASSGSDLGVAIDSRRIQHFYNSNGAVAQLSLLPVDLFVYRLKKTSEGGEERLSLVADKLGENEPRVLMVDAIKDPTSAAFKPPADILYFARKLGTTTVEIVIENESVQ